MKLGNYAGTNMNGDYLFYYSPRIGVDYVVCTMEDIVYAMESDIDVIVFDHFISFRPSTSTQKDVDAARDFLTTVFMMGIEI